MKTMGSNTCVDLMLQLTANVLSLSQNCKKYLAAINEHNKSKNNRENTKGIDNYLRKC